MKKIFLLTGILMVTAMTATYAQYTNDDDDNTGVVKSTITKTMNEIQKEGAESNQEAVSAFTVNQFASDFPDVTNIHFERIKDYDKVTYSLDGRDNTAYYDDNNELIGTIRNRSIQDLPAEAQKEIAEGYPNYTIVGVVRFNANSDNESFIDNNSNLPVYGDSSDDSSHYFVELKNDRKAIVLRVGLSGEVSFFTTMK